MSESQITLVDCSPPFTLVFTKDSITNTTILSNRRLLYVISTDTIIGNRTTITDAAGHVVSSIHRRDLFADTICFPLRGDKKFKVKQWLVPHCVDGKPIHFINTYLGRCLWRHDSMSRPTLHLTESSPSSSPLVYLEPASSNGPLCLVFDSSRFPTDEFGGISLASRETKEFVEDALMSVLILELHLRTQEALTELSCL